MKKSVSIFGGGITGLTVAHELIEKGKIVSNHILRKNYLKKSTLITHESSWIIKIFQIIDDILYKYNLPNIVDVLVIILVIILILLIIFFIKKKRT